jgi:capsid protein
MNKPNRPNPEHGSVYADDAKGVAAGTGVSYEHFARLFAEQLQL